jgi:hypothetical protein
MGEESTDSQAQGETPNATADETVESQDFKSSMADLGEFVTPVQDQGEQPSAADEEPRQPEAAPNETDADQSSLGGTGGITVTTTNT